MRMPPVEETLASYLLQGELSSLKAPTLPSKLLQKNLHLDAPVSLSELFGTSVETDELLKRINISPPPSPPHAL